MITLNRLRRHRQGEHRYPDESPLPAMERLAPNGQPTFPGGPPPFLAAPVAPVTEPRPVFTARVRPGAMTRPQLVLDARDPMAPSRCRPYVPAEYGDPLSPGIPVPVTATAVIGDGMTPVPPWEPPAGDDAPGTWPALYSGPGWTRALADARRRNGEVEELPALVEDGLGRNAAEFERVARHFRERITQGARDCCTALGRPDLARVLLDRVAGLAWGRDADRRTAGD